MAKNGYLVNFTGTFLEKDLNLKLKELFKLNDNNLIFVENKQNYESL
jgi:hypothetical protein